MDKLIRYISYKLGCIHPFWASRLLVLANWRNIEEKGKPIVGFKVGGFEAGFYIENFKDYLENQCYKKNEEKKCLEYLCDEPDLPEDVKNLIDRLIEETRDMDDTEINRLVIRDPRYRELLEKGGFSSN